ncbi:unnamed protein product, partial [Closterium sp. NIES-53]
STHAATPAPHVHILRSIIPCITQLVSIYTTTTTTIPFSIPIASTTILRDLSIPRILSITIFTALSIIPSEKRTPPCQISLAIPSHCAGNTTHPSPSVTSCCSSCPCSTSIQTPTRRQTSNRHPVHKTLPPWWIESSPSKPLILLHTLCLHCRTSPFISSCPV